MSGRCAQVPTGQAVRLPRPGKSAHGRFQVCAGLPDRRYSLASGRQIKDLRLRRKRAGDHWLGASDVAASSWTIEREEEWRGAPMGVPDKRG
jgi:hypothetical protein